MIIAVSLYTKKATYFHVIDPETLATIESIAQTAVITEEVVGLNGSCHALILKPEKGTLKFKSSEEICAVKIYLDKPTQGHTREDVIVTLSETFVSVIPSFESEKEISRKQLKKITPTQKIVLMRHSIHKNDIITKEGKALVLQRAKDLIEVGVFTVVSTPATRCVQTAQLIASELGTSATTATHEEIIGMIEFSPDKNWLIVSHQPTIEEWSGDLGGYFSPEMGEFKIF